MQFRSRDTALSRISPYWLAASLLSAGVAFATSAGINKPDFTTTAVLAIDLRLASRMRDVDVLEHASRTLQAETPALALTAADLARRIEIAPRGRQRMAFLFRGDTAEEAVAIGSAAIEALAESQRPQGRRKQELRLAAAQERQLLQMYLTGTNVVLAFMTTQEEAASKGSVPAKYVVGILQTFVTRLLTRVGDHQTTSRDHARELRGMQPGSVIVRPQTPEDGKGAVSGLTLSASLSALVFLVVFVAGQALSARRSAHAARPAGRHIREDAR